MALSLAISKRPAPESELLDSDSSKHLNLSTSVQYPLIRASCIRLPAPKIPQLSKSTQEIIESLRTQKPSTQKTPSFMSPLTASDKYSYLLTSLKSLPIPNHYLKLVKLFKAVDFTISFFHYNRSPTLFNRIKDAVCKTYQMSCDLNEVQQILTVFPGCYKVYWTMFEKNFTLFIDFPENKSPEELAKRPKAFDEKIFSIVEGYHSIFIKGIGQKWEDPGNWHPDFPITEIPHINLTLLPEKPAGELSDTSKFVSNLYNFQNLTEKTEEIVEGNIEGLSFAIAAKVLAKEKLLKSKRMDLVDVEIAKEQYQGEKILKMVGILKTLFATQKTPSIFLSHLVPKLGNMLGNKNLRIVEEDILETIKTFPSFLSLIQTSSGQVVRCNRISDFKIIDIRQELKNKYNLT